MAKITQEELKKHLHYDPATGVFTRTSSGTSARWAGREAGTKNKDGYVYIYVAGGYHLAHRLAFIYMTGNAPPFVDHIDGMSNAWRNLRPTTREGNGTNARGWAATKTGVKGVYRQPGRKNYIALVTVGGRSLWLGAFPTIAEAKLAYTEAQKKKALGLFGSTDALKKEAY